MIIEVTDKAFGESVANPTAGTVLVDFWATWCGPCRMLAPILQEVDAEIGDRLTIAKLDVDQNPETASRFGVMSIPTMIVFRNGEAVSKMVGLQSKEQLLEWIKEYL